MEESPHDVIKNAAKLGAEAYQKLLNNEFEYFKIENINCRALPTIEEGFLKIENFWDKLHFKDKKKEWTINAKSCLYYFEIDQPKEETNQLILNAFLNFRNSPEGRNCSALKSNALIKTQTLYVGKVKNGIGGRMVVHFGYANPKTGGLQLAHWAKSVGLILHLHIFVFDEKMKEFVEPLEFLLANSLRPLIGKH